eukprot:CAMPEP_0170528776 /NCGR_PEP_ID=MMETSP0209-20121228/14239_1 /TAXON_ID=665100 ORGANISM="Litonotus pictus, Strain P1" /NCGR_SAMPLE_ID=MMETSP0209 /ASSEMBLY_ACC=CAM_ASM_000301 /LENGTH=1698 /DNA_ID=CAMNT_0010820173 /DNA_START=20 /DNA_END=5113 /DNA_ORIENTATION=+
MKHKKSSFTPKNSKTSKKDSYNKTDNTNTPNHNTGKQKQSFTEENSYGSGSFYQNPKQNTHQKKPSQNIDYSQYSEHDYYGYDYYKSRKNTRTSFSGTEGKGSKEYGYKDYQYGKSCYEENEHDNLSANSNYMNSQNQLYQGMTKNMKNKKKSCNEYLIKNAMINNNNEWSSSKNNSKEEEKESNNEAEKRNIESNNNIACERIPRNNDPHNMQEESYKKGEEGESPDLRQKKISSQGVSEEMPKVQEKKDTQSNKMILNNECKGTCIKLSCLEKCISWDLILLPSQPMKEQEPITEAHTYSFSDSKIAGYHNYYESLTIPILDSAYFKEGAQKSTQYIPRNHKAKQTSPESSSSSVPVKELTHIDKADPEKRDNNHLILLERLNHLPILNKKYNFMILEANFAIRDNLKNVFLLEFDLKASDNQAIQDYSILNNSFVQREANFLLRASLHGKNLFESDILLSLEQSKIVKSIQFKLQSIKDRLKSNATNSFNKGYNNYYKESALNQEEKMGILRTKVLSNLNFGIEFQKPNLEKIQFYPTNFNSIVNSDIRINKLFFEITIPKTVIDNNQSSAEFTFESKQSRKQSEYISMSKYPKSPFENDINLSRTYSDSINKIPFNNPTVNNNNDRDLNKSYSSNTGNLVSNPEASTGNANTKNLENVYSNKFNSPMGFQYGAMDLTSPEYFNNRFIHGKMFYENVRQNHINMSNGNMPYNMNNNNTTYFNQRNTKPQNFPGSASANFKNFTNLNQNSSNTNNTNKNNNIPSTLASPGGIVPAKNHQTINPISLNQDDDLSINNKSQSVNIFPEAKPVIGDAPMNDNLLGQRGCPTSNDNKKERWDSFNQMRPHTQMPMVFQQPIQDNNFRKSSFTTSSLQNKMAFINFSGTNNMKIGSMANMNNMNMGGVNSRRNSDLFNMGYANNKHYNNPSFYNNIQQMGPQKMVYMNNMNMSGIPQTNINSNNNSFKEQGSSSQIANANIASTHKNKEAVITDTDSSKDNKSVATINTANTPNPTYIRNTYFCDPDESSPGKELVPRKYSKSLNEKINTSEPNLKRKANNNYSAGECIEIKHNVDKSFSFKKEKSGSGNKLVEEENKENKQNISKEEKIQTTEFCITTPESNKEGLVEENKSSGNENNSMSSNVTSNISNGVNNASNPNPPQSNQSNLNLNINLNINMNYPFYNQLSGQTQPFGLVPSNMGNPQMNPTNIFNSNLTQEEALHNSQMNFNNNYNRFLHNLVKQYQQANFNNSTPSNAPSTQQTNQEIPNTTSISSSQTENNRNDPAPSENSNANSISQSPQDDFPVNANLPFANQNYLNFIKANQMNMMNQNPQLNPLNASSAHSLFSNPFNLPFMLYNQSMNSMNPNQNNINSPNNPGTFNQFNNYMPANSLNNFPGLFPGQNPSMQLNHLNQMNQLYSSYLGNYSHIFKNIENTGITGKNILQSASLFCGLNEGTSNFSLLLKGITPQNKDLVKASQSNKTNVSIGDLFSCFEYCGYSGLDLTLFHDKELLSINYNLNLSAFEIQIETEKDYHTVKDALIKEGLLNTHEDDLLNKNFLKMKQDGYSNSSFYNTKRVEILEIKPCLKEIKEEISLAFYSQSPYLSIRFNEKGQIHKRTCLKTQIEKIFSTLKFLKDIDCSALHADSWFSILYFSGKCSNSIIAGTSFLAFYDFNKKSILNNTSTSNFIGVIPFKMEEQIW